MHLLNTAHTGPRKNVGAGFAGIRQHFWGFSLNGGFGVGWLVLLNPSLAGIASLLGARTKHMSKG
jgi:hypothetical protein